jgi:excisionase family DNA binding protein
MPFKGTSMPDSASEGAAQQYFRVADVAARFDVDETTVYRQIKAGRLKAIRIGSGRGTVRISAKSLAEYEADITAAALAEVA